MHIFSFNFSYISYLNIIFIKINLVKCVFPELWSFFIFYNLNKIYKHTLFYITLNMKKKQ